MTGSEAKKKLQEDKKLLLFKGLDKEPDLTIPQLRARIKMSYKQAEQWRKEWKSLPRQ